MSIRNTRSRRRGSAIAGSLVIVAMCTMIAASALLSNIGSAGEARTSLAAERAFEAADAGIDWGIAKLRITKGTIPNPAQETCDVDPSVTALVRYTRGDLDGLDENGDGTVDDAGEAQYTLVTSTGTAGGVRRTLQVLLRHVVEIPTFPGAVIVNNGTPIVDLDGGAFRISGTEHRIDGHVDNTRPEKFGISSTGDVSDLLLDYGGHGNQISGSGGSPSAGTIPPIDLDTRIAQAFQATTIMLAAGTRTSDLTLGTPTVAGVEVVGCHGDLEFSGHVSGAGVLVVDGDLTVSGGFEWTGFILVRGCVRLTGGGNGTVITGTLICGEELRIAGTVDIHYSTDAVDTAGAGLQIPIVLTWRETGSQ